MERLSDDNMKIQQGSKDSNYNYNRRGSNDSNSNYNRRGSNDSIFKHKRRGSSNLSNISSGSNYICVDSSSGRLECVNNLYSESTNSSSKSQNSTKSAKSLREYQSGEWGPDIILYSAPSGSNS